jgi:hypothetical protein
VCQACLHVHVLDNCLTFFGQEWHFVHGFHTL